ncbi:MAG: sirohydrochlorin chelatase [Pirellulales bacterium]
MSKTTPDKSVGSMIAATAPPPVGLLLVGHGTRDVRGIDEFHTLCRRVTKRWGGGPVGHGFLELAKPTIRSGLDRLAREGVRHVVAVPVLLGEASHAKEDIPQVVAAAERSTGVSVELAGPLACHPQIVRLSLRRCCRAIEASQPVPPAGTCLILVARGSSDRQAAEQIGRFAALRVDPSRFAVVRTAFLTAASPLLEEALRNAGQEAWTRVIVQPHLLFHGQLVGQVAEHVARLRVDQPRLDWLVTPHLGPSALVANALVDRAAGVLQRE